MEAMTQSVAMVYILLAVDTRDSTLSHNGMLVLVHSDMVVLLVVDMR
jgi:hypothetical protein